MIGNAGWRKSSCRLLRSGSSGLFLSDFKPVALTRSNPSETDGCFKVPSLIDSHREGPAIPICEQGPENTLDTAFMNPKAHLPSTGTSGCILAGFLFATANIALAQTSTWNLTTGGSWNTGGNWTGGIPDGSSAIATFSQNFTGTPIVTLDRADGFTVNQITYEDTGTTGDVALSINTGTGGKIILAGTTPTINATNNLTIGTALDGATSLTKTGTGTLTLSGANTYSGNTIVSAGSVTVSGDHSGATGGWTINSGAASVSFAAGSTISVGAGNHVTTANGSGSAGRSLSVAGTVTTSSTSNLTIRGRNTFTINNGGSWTMEGGTLTIQPLNTTYSATLTVNTGGSFTYNGTNGIVLTEATTGNDGNGSINLAGGTFTTTRGISNSGAGNGGGTSNFNFSAGGTLKISNDIASIFTQGSQPFNITTGTGGGVIDTNGFNTATSVGISGAGGLSKTGAGTLTLSGTNSYTGGTNVLGGILNTTQAGALASHTTAGKIVINGGTLGVRVGGGGWTTGEVDAMLANATKTSGALGIDTTNGSITQWTTFTTANLGPSLGLDKLGANTLTLDQTNTYTGGTRVLGGILNTTQAGALASHTTAGKVVINGGTLGVRVGGGGWTTGEVDAMLANATKTSGALGIDTTNGSITQWTAFTTANLGPSLGVEKLGANSLTLDQTNTYTGATTVSAGTLYVTGTLSNSAVTVGASGTIATNGIAGTLGNGLTIQEGGNLDLTGATIALDSTGILSLTGGSLTLGNLTFQDLVGWDWLNAEEGTYELIEGTFAIDWGATAHLSPETAYDFGNGRMGYFTSGSLNVVIVPEPRAALLGGLGLLFLLCRRRVA